MAPKKCRGCNHNKNAPEGICSIKLAKDGLPVRCVGEWSEAKYYYLKKYIEIFTISMRKKWELYYVDLFAGPGKCRIRESEKEIDGSTLIALNSPYPFSKYYFVDLNRHVLDALWKRCASHQYRDRVVLINNDCNLIINDIIENIPQNSLSLAFIDPTGLQFNFPTLEKMSDRRMDLIINFPDSMAARRNLKIFLEKSHSPLDNVIGDSSWRLCSSVKDLINSYKEKVSSLNYEIEGEDEIFIRSSKRNLPLYCLLHASKHPLAKKFWKEITKISPNGQRKLL